ncbi:MAG: lipoate--protein ligase family protein [Methanomassiliicoccaceae archaeon]|jgi:lipoate-protein ligase A|nr:lipoate--protein ligase family protein [Methanomassiliicoccaceae archaeon]
MRFIDLGVVTPEYSVSADKVLLKRHSSAGDDTLMIYSRDRPCISVGRFQRIEDTVDLEYTKRNNISVVRRISGGSNIYTDTSQMTYSVIVSKDRLPTTRDDSFAVICGAVVLALKRLGINGVHKPVNDVLVNGKKISGGAQARSWNAVLQHGSIILDVDDRVVRSSLIDNKKRSYDGLTSIRECLGYVPSRDVISKAFLHGFSEVFGNITEGRLSSNEADEIKQSADLFLLV